MSDALELAQWQALWQAETAVPVDLRELAKKQLRRVQTLLWVDVGVTSGVGGAVVAWYLVNGEPAVRQLAIWVWVTLIGAWIFRWMNPQNWSGAAPNTEVFLEKLRGSYRAGLRNLKFGWVLGGVQLIFSARWVYGEISEKTPLTVWQFLTLKISLAVWAAVALLFGSTIWLFVKLKRQLALVERLQGEYRALGAAPVEIRQPAESLVGRMMDEFRNFLRTLPLPGELAWELRRKKKSVRRV